jgi:hypothetical protein
MPKAKKEGKPKRNRRNLAKKLKRIGHNDSIITKIMQKFKIAKR